MSSLDDPDRVDPFPARPSGSPQARSADSLLVESLIYALIEKGVLTKNDAMSVVQTVAEVMQGTPDEGPISARTEADLAALHRLFVSFKAIDDRPGTAVADEGNVRRLRRPVHGDDPHFPDRQG